MDDSYVTYASWVRTTGRVDAVDEIADQFERPVATSVWPVAATQPWSRTASRWPSPGRLLRRA